MKQKTKSVKQTIQIAQRFAKKLKTGKIVAFYGELGAGKTTFIKAIANELGIDQELKSPTYIIARNYLIPNSKQYFWHIDLYRISSVKELRSINLEEILEDENNIIMIEWAKHAKSILPKKRINVYINKQEENKRLITINVSK